MAEEVVKTRKPRTRKKKTEETKAEEVKATEEEVQEEKAKEEEVKEEKPKKKTTTKKSTTKKAEAKEPEEEVKTPIEYTDEDYDELTNTELDDTEVDDEAVEVESERINDRLSSTKSERDLMLNGKSVVPASKKMRRILYSDSDIIPLGDELQFQSEGAHRKEKYLEIISSMRSRNVLTGTIYSTKTIDGMICAVVDYSPFDVLLPQDFFLTDRDKEVIASEQTDKDKEKRTRRLINERIGSEVDFIVRKVDEENGVAIGDRIAAMNIRQRAWFFNKDRRGEYIIKEGTKAEARVVSANTNSITVETCGMEFKLKQESIAYTRIANVQAEYPVGSTVPIVFKKIERSTQAKKRTLKVVISMKEALVDTREREFNKYGVGDLVRATVTGVEPVGVFCRLGGLQGKQDILCKYPDVPKYSTDTSVLPKLNDDVLVKILHKDEEDKEGNKIYRIAGTIIRKI